MRRVALVLTLFLAAAGTAHAAAEPKPIGPVYDAKGRIVETPLAPTTQPTRLTPGKAVNVFLAYPKVKDWLSRYPTKGRTTNASWKAATRAWEVHVFQDKAGEVATGRVDDATTAVTEAWTGPQVAWGMARGSPGAFGGTKLNSYPVWLAFCGIFLLGLVDWRRPLSLRTLDLVALLSF